MMSAFAITPAVASTTNPVFLYLSTLPSPASRRTMAQALRLVADLIAPGVGVETFPWHALRYEHLVAIRSRLAEDHKPATVNKVLAAVRGVLRAARQLGLIDGDVYQTATDLRNLRNESRPAGRMLLTDELQAMLAVCRRDPSPAGSRDGALLAVLWTCGLRRSEIVSLDREDYHSTGELIVRAGKGRKERSVWVNRGAATWLQDWLCHRGDEPGPLFCPVNKAGRVVLRRLSAQAVYFILRRRGEEVGLAPFSPHDLRRSMISHLLDAGIDIVTVAQIAGHANIQTTARYDRRGDEVKRRAAAVLEI